MLLARKDAHVKTDLASFLTAINEDLGSGGGTYDNLTDSQEATADNIGVAGAGLSTLATDARVVSVAQFLTRKDAALANDKPGMLADINADTGTGAGSYSNLTDSQEAIRDRGDAAWVTGLTTLGATAPIGWIDAAAIAANAISAEKIATDAITAAKLAADAVTKIQSGLATPTNITAGTLTTVTNLTNERGKYALGAVWIGPTANTNTVSYVDGIITNPVSTLAAAKTIADALGLRRFYTVRSGDVRLEAAMTNYDFDGNAWSLNTTGGSRDVSDSHFANAKVVGGTYASTSAESHWDDCEFSTGVSVGEIHATRCTFQGTLTLTAAGDYDFVDCASVVAGTSAPVFAVPAGVVNISFRRWSGGIRITGITADTTISIDMVSGGTVTLEGADGNVQVRGMVTDIVDSRAGTPTLGQNAAVNMTKINAEVDSALDTAIPVSPTADSINERVATMDGRILGTLAAGTHTVQTGDSYAVVSSVTHGNAALKTLIDTVDTVVDAIKVEVDKVPRTGTTYTWTNDDSTAAATVSITGDGT
jgi:hypothetical protein